VAVRIGEADVRTTAFGNERNPTMRSIATALGAVLALSLGVFAQSDLPKCLQDTTPANLNFRNVTIPEVLRFLGNSCGVEVRLEGVEETPPTRNVQFTRTKLADAFVFLVRGAGLTYTVLDEKTVLVTKP
jgi:hypothetical protein